MPNIGVFAIILDNEKRVLLCHRNDMDLWNLPGGGLEAQESPWQGVIREVKEETDLDVEVIRLAGVYYKPEKDEIVFSFVCNIVGGHPKNTDEADKIAYFSLAEIPRNTSPKQVERIKDYFVDPNKTHLKTQVGPSSRELVNQGKL